MKTHGHTQQIGGRGGKVIKSPTYQSWSNCNGRCYDEGQRYYKDYGGRGIDVCERWRRGTPDAFSNFLEDMGVRPPGLTLDRVNVNEGYSKDNCRWADAHTQRVNQRSRT